MVRRARCLALSRGLGHADVWDAPRGRPAYRGHDDAAAREIDPRSGARPDLRRDPRLQLRKSWQPGAGIFRADHPQIRRHPARPAGAGRGPARRHPGAPWSHGSIEASRLRSAPEMTRVVVAIDPAVTSGDAADETGIVVAGKDKNGHGYVLADISGRYPPTEWARLAITAYRTHRADRIVAEVNNGGDMVGATLRMVDPNVAFTAVRASRGKVVRAEPVVALYQQGRVHHIGTFPQLEDQMTSFTSDIDRAAAGYSPDRVDALVWAFSELLVEPMESEGIYEFYRQEAEAAEQRDKPQPAKAVYARGSMEWLAEQKKSG